MAEININMAVSGAKECQQQLSAATTSVKQMQSALKLADSEFKLTGDATAMYASKIQTLQNQIAAQTQAVEAAQRGLKAMSDAYGENSTQAGAWQAKLNNAQAGLNNLQASLNEMTGKLAEASAGMAATAGAAGNLSGALSGMAGGSYSMDGLNSSLGQSQAEIKKTQDQLAQLQGQIKETGGTYYNVGNMSISGSNGGKMASVVSGMAKSLDSIVKSSAETASHTDDLGTIILGGVSGGSMTAGGVMSTVGGIASNFGPWGAMAGAVLQLGGSIVDAIGAANEREEQRRREAEVNAYWNNGVDKQAIDRLSAALSQRQEIVAEITNHVSAEVTANVDGLRVIIQEATEDGKVNRREVGTVRKYVQEVLMADYDDAVKDLLRMRGELWKLATQGYTAEEVAMYGVRTGDPEQATLYKFLQGFLGGENSFVKEYFDNNTDIENAATQLWLYLAKEFGSAEAMTEAFRDPTQRDTVQRHIYDWLLKSFDGKGLDNTKASLMAQNLMTELFEKAEQGFTGSNATASGSWLGNTEGGGIFVEWVKSLLPDSDKEAALAYAQDAWTAVINAATSPEAAVQAIHGTSGEEAAKQWEKGKDTDAAKAFGVMVQWVMQTLKIKDKKRAVEIAIGMWDEVQKAASYGTTGSGTPTVDSSWITSTPAGANFSAYVAQVLDEDDEKAAIEKAKGMWAAVVAAASSPETAIGEILTKTGEEAAEEAKANPESETAKTFNAFLDWVHTNYPDDDATAAEEKAIALWNGVRSAAAYGTEDGTQLTPDTAWIAKTEAGTALTDYISALMKSDYDAALIDAENMWKAVIKAASSPEAAIGAMSSASGEEAAAEAEANPESETGKAFNAMVQWVQDTCGEDKTSAIQTAIEMWDLIRRAGFYGIDETGTDHKAAPTAKYTFAGSDAMRQYISQRMGTDFEQAIADANDYWDRLTDAVLGKTQPDNDKPDLRADLLSQALEDYKKTLGEIEKVTKEMEGATGDDLDEKIAYLEELLDKAEKLGNRIETLRKGMNENEGAYNLVTYGKGTASETDVASAFAYLEAMKGIADQAYADAIAEAEKRRREVYQKYNPKTDNSPEAVAAREAAEKAYADAKAKADAEYESQKATYEQMVSDMVNKIITDKSGYEGGQKGEFGGPDMPNVAMSAAMALIQSGVLNDLSAETLSHMTGPLQEALYAMFFQMPVVQKHGKELKYLNGLSEVVEKEGEEYSYVINGVEYKSLDEIPLYKQIKETGSYVDFFAELFKDSPFGAFSESRWTGDFAYKKDNGDGTTTYTDAKSGQSVTFGNDEGGVELPFDVTSFASETEDAKEEIEEVAEEAEEVAEEVEEALEAIEGNAEAAGKNMADSFSNSIDTNTPSVVDAAIRMAEAFDAAFKGRLGIASPSKLMMAYGAYTAEGLAEGIDANIAMVTRASRRMASAVAGPVADAAGSTSRTVNNSATSSLYIDKYYQRSDADVDSLAAAIADKNRLGRYGNGLRG